MKKLLPPVLYIALIIAMIAVCWMQGWPDNISSPANYLGLIFAVGGLAIAFYHSRLFEKLNANIMTFDKPTHLVKTGLFKYSRNPMYLGFLVSLLGVAIVFKGAYTSFALVLLFFAVSHFWYIPFEERYMAETFGEDYARYCRETSRWLGVSR